MSILTPIAARSRRLLPVLLAPLAFLALASTPGWAAAWLLDLEGARVWSGYNDVRIPGDGGTRFSLTEDLRSEAGFCGRLRLGIVLAERHHLSAFAAPLRLDAAGQAPATLLFAGTEFPAASRLSASYRFDSYRLTYRYRLRATSRFTGWLGFTAKLRDAEIAVAGAGLRAKKTNTGFVPLLAFRGDWRLDERFGISCEGDALAGGPGRAEDVFLGLTYRRNSRLTLRGGYRLIEGGADVAEVYSFARLDFASLGLELSF